MMPGVLRRVWKGLPLSDAAKQRLKTAAFRTLPFLLARTQAYQAWKEDRTLAETTSAWDPRGPEAPYEPPEVIYVPVADVAPVEAKPARVICFYLPQYHPIPENNAWWGDGFTDWTNVKRAEPQFVGHDQPRVPGELGYYDLRDAAVQRRQVELARLYGIEGFCFYFYWFHGKRLLERPLESYLSDKSLELPFCLCWANENWSRRWDGLDNEVLIAQAHSPDDDLAFIAHVARYIRDERYIRVDGKPLLVVYRPNLLPSASATVERWRNWCRENGIGEIYLAYTQSFEALDPHVYGFDAAIEFPPNYAMRPRDITQSVTPLSEGFESAVCDWRLLVQRSERYSQPPYPLFRGVCPGWDNTARRRNRAKVLVHNTPALFGRWLHNAIRDTRQRFADSDERLIFVNAWNEWAEAAYLEPDRTHGYAWLEAVRIALARNADQCRPDTSEPRAAIVVHTFYPDLLGEILELVRALPSRHKLFVTTTVEHADGVRARLDASGRDFALTVVENRGRDMLPFFKAYQHVRSEGFDYLVKLHTKRSTQRTDGDAWRRDLYGKLLEPEAFERTLTAFAADPEIGMVGPAGHFVSLSAYIGSNERRVRQIAGRLGLDEKALHDQGFFAGTMFFARATALEPLMGMAFPDDAFEPEEGQIDGTLAHALERAMTLSVRASGMRIASTADLTGQRAAEAGAPSDRYRFA